MAKHLILTLMGVPEYIILTKGVALSFIGLVDIYIKMQQVN